MMEARAALDRLNQLFIEQPSVNEAKLPIRLGALDNSIAFEHVEFSYPHVDDRVATRVLCDVTVVIRKGDLTVIVGPSGGGKTTLLNLLLRLYDPTSGSVLVDGTNIRNIALASLRSQIGFVSQEILLMDGTIRNNVRMGKLDASDEEIWEALGAAEIADFVRELVNGLDTRVGERGAMLSGGQRQRLALARALVRRPSLLVLDEPTSSLDAQNERELLATLRDLNLTRQLTIIAVTHRLQLAIFADQVLVIADGRLESSGRHDALMAKKGAYAALWSQAAAN